MGKMSGEDTPEPERNGPRTTKRRRTQEHNNNSLGDSVEEDSTLTTALSRGVVPDNASEKCGILEWITVKNFMCHDHLNFEFSPSINFVQGRNGSGKSAILTALVVGLGGGARFTNRGRSMKELVKHGKQVAIIEIALRNCGKYPFKPDVYGRTIIVERKILASGGGTYRLKSANGQLVSTRKEDLGRMLEHYNLQVDNPVTVLNQDMSRSFLNTMDPKQLFKFFLKATQLQQMQDNYIELENSIKSSLKIIESRRKALPDLEKEVDEQRSHYEFSVSIREKKKKLQDLRHELAWANIIYKEKEKEKAEKALADNEAARTKLKGKLDMLHRMIDEDKELNRKATDNFNKATQNLEVLLKDVKDVEKKMKTIKQEYKNKQSEVSVAEKRVRGINSEIATLKATIEKDNNSQQRKWADERAEWQRKIAEVKNQIEESLGNLKTETTHYQNLQNTLDVKKSEETPLVVEGKAIQRRLNELERELRGLQGQQGSQLTVYGQWVPQLLKKIDAAFAKNLFKKKPVGPIGAFIEVRDKKWVHVAESVLGNRITSFCVDNQQDERVLSNLMKEVDFMQQGKPIVTVAKFREKVHDVSRFETCCRDYSSLWSMLSVSNTVVANTIIDQLQVESMLLIPTAQEAGRLLKDKTLVPKNCKCAYTLNLDLYYPDPNYRLYSGKGSHKARFLQVSVEDKIREVTVSRDECKKQLESLVKQTKEGKMEIKKIEDEISVSNKKMKQHQRKLDTLRMKITELQNQDIQQPPDISQLEDDVKQQEELLQKAQASVERLQKAMLTSKTKFTEMSGQLIALKKSEHLAYEEADKCKRELDRAKDGAASTTIRTYLSKDKELELKETALRKAVDAKTESLNASLRSREGVDIGPRIETRKSVAELERQYISLQARLNKETASSGDPLAVAERYKATKLRYKQIKDDLDRHQCLLKKLKESLVNREGKCWRFYKWLGVIVKFYFKEHLAVRKLDGSLNINLDEKKLTIHVEKPDNSSSPRKMKANKSKAATLVDLAMMSGGERSFSTVSFIIALWQAIDSPVRILDEFDVFMDVIARSRAMKMMISAAKKNNQYIFLTPLTLSLDTSKLDNCVIFRMPDPERREDEEAEGT